MRRKHVILRKAFAMLSVFLALLLACGIAFPSQARAEEAEIETRPTVHNAVVLVLDDSGSMEGSPTERLREAAKKFSEKILEADKGAKIAIVSFSYSTKILPFTSNIDDVRSFVDSKMRADGGTDVTLGLEGADTTAKLLQDSAFVRYAKSIVTMSDGKPNDDDSAIRQARSMFPNYNMYSVGFFKDGDNAEAIEFLKSIQNSGYFEANDLDALIKKFLEIADELLNPIEISLSHDYTKGTTDKRSFTLRAEIRNPNFQKVIKNLKINLKLPEGITLQEGNPEKTWIKFEADKIEKLEWKVKVSDSATGPFVYSVTARGDNIVDLTQSDKIILKAQKNNNQFVFGKDNWSFSNNFDEWILNGHDKYALFNGLEESERGEIQHDINGRYGGSCYGFAVSSVLKKMGQASPLQRQPGVTCLYGMDSTKDVQSYINYYQLTQNIGSIRSDKIKFITKSEPDKAKELKKRVSDVARGGSPVILCFQTPYGGHAVVADIYESGSWRDGKYNGRIRYYDSNEPNDENRYAYINTDSGAFEVREYGGKSRITRANNDLSIMNKKDITAKDNQEAILTARTKTIMVNAYLSRGNKKTWSMIEVFKREHDLTWFFEDRDADSEPPVNIVLPDNKEDYSVSSPDAYDYSLKYPDAFLLVQSAGAESASFERGGTVKLAHNTGSYKLTSTLDSATGDLYTFGVTGTDGGNVELRKTEGGYVIKADSLKGATAEASGDDVTKSIALDGDATEVQISSDGTDITASIDEDGDGIFEKAIGSSAQGAKQGKDDNKQNKGDDGTPGPTDQGSKVSSTFNGNAGSARVSDVQPERGGGDLPKTGDSSPLFVALPLAVLGALATVLGIVLRRRRGDADSGGVDG